MCLANESSEIRKRLGIKYEWIVCHVIGPYTVLSDQRRFMVPYDLLVVGHLIMMCVKALFALYHSYKNCAPKLFLCAYSAVIIVQRDLTERSVG